VKRILMLVSAAVLMGASPAPSPAPSPDPGAIAAVTQYVRAVSRGDFSAAYDLLTVSQQRYFLNAKNFASNAQAAGYTIRRYAVAGTRSHGSIVEVVVRQDVSFLDITSRRKVNGTVREPYFALRENGAWRVKQLYQPWKSYAPNASGSAAGVEVVVDRVEFYDERVRVDCTIRNLGTTPVQVLPLGKTTLDDGSGAKIPAMNEMTFPLNDLGFYEGLRLYPGRQAAGYINFAVSGKKDETQAFTLTVGPAIHDAAEQTFTIMVGPFSLPKL